MAYGRYRRLFVGEARPLDAIGTIAICADGQLPERIIALACQFAAACLWEECAKLRLGGSIAKALVLESDLGREIRTISQDASYDSQHSLRLLLLKVPENCNHDIPRLRLAAEIPTELAPLIAEMARGMLDACGHPAHSPLAITAPDRSLAEDIVRHLSRNIGPVVWQQRRRVRRSQLSRNWSPLN